MDKLSFISTLIAHLAWPVSLIFAVLLLRKPFIGILASLKRIKVKDVEMDFTEAIKSIQRDVTSGPGGGSWKVTSTKDLKPNMQWLASRSPLGVVLHAWDSFESAVIACAEQASGLKFINAGIAVEWLENNGKINDGYINIYYRLLAIKTRFSNFESENLPKERALEYSDTVLSIAREIQDKCRRKE